MQALPDRHELTITYRDSASKTHTSTSVLDWNAFWGRRWLDEKTIHHAAKSLETMAKTMGKWTEDLHGGLAVFTRDGAAKDQRQQETYEELDRLNSIDAPLVIAEETLQDGTAADADKADEASDGRQQ